MAFTVSQRTREIGVRMALGARPDEVLRMILAEGLKLVAAGVVIGVAAALMLTRLLEGLVYGVRVRDPLVFAAVNVLTIAVSLGACYVPAWRATRVDPLVALRYE
jgi:putative ABC transport system permease protein